MKLGIDASKVMQFLLIGAIVMFALTTIIDLNAFGKGTCEPSTYKTKKTCEDNSGTWTATPIFKSDVDYSGKCIPEQYKDKESCEANQGIWSRGLIGNVYVWILLAIAVMLTWRISGERLNRKALVSMIFIGIALYFLYNYLLAPHLGLKTIEFAAIQLQAMMP